MFDHQLVKASKKKPLPTRVTPESAHKIQNWSGMGQKSFKGSVSIVNDTNRVRLRWTYKGKRYSLNLFHYSKTNLLKARKIAVLIEHDIINDKLDASLNKYRPSYLVNEPQKESIVSVFILWAKNCRNRDCDKDVDYYLIKRMLERWKHFDIKDTCIRLNNEPICPKTYNTRLRLLKSFFSWASKKNVVDHNPLEDVKPKKSSKIKKANRKPFSEVEISLILDAFKNDRFTPPSSRVKHSFYYPLVYFIFKMGVRNAEAIGLRVQHIDLINRVVNIKEVMARTIKGSHSNARIRKETKNGKERKLPLDEATLTILMPLLTGKNLDDLVFSSVNKLPIDDRMFQRRIFKKVLNRLNIEDRVLYACRHTFASRCIADGLTPVMTAFLMGNNPETALRNYTHLIELPRNLPSVEKKD